MATASKSKPDYDPIEEALDIGYSEGRKSERGKRTEHVERARRGGARHGGAAAKRQAESDRARRAKKTREANARMRASRALREQESTAAARRGAYRSGQAAQKRAADDARREAKRLSPSGGRAASTAARRPRPTPARLSAPSTTATGSEPILPTMTQVDKVTSSRIILVAVVIGAVGTVAHDAITGAAPTKTQVTTRNGVQVAVPNHLRSLGGVFIMGTVAFIVNEFDPGIGLLLGVGILLDVGVATLTGKDGVFTRLGNGLFGGAKGFPVQPKGTPSSSPSSGLKPGSPGAKAGAGGGGGGGGSWGP